MIEEAAFLHGMRPAQDPEGVTSGDLNLYLWRPVWRLLLRRTSKNAKWNETILIKYKKGGVAIGRILDLMGDHE